MDVEIRTGEPMLAFMRPISVAFGNEPSDEESAERFQTLIDPQRMHSAHVDGALIGAAGAFTYELTVPGGVVPAAGVTIVGVLPTHRRRGVLRQMMRAQLDDIRARGEPVAYLWASDERIYGRFGYGVASLQMSATIDTRTVAFRADGATDVRVRLLDADEAFDVIPAIYDRARREWPGMFSRSDAWWRNRRLFDSPQRPAGFGALFRAVLEMDGEAQAYALYRSKFDFAGFAGATVEVNEAIGTSSISTREIWRYLFNLDLAHTVRASRLPVDHPLVLMVQEPRRLKPEVADALWVRLVDIGSALRARKLDGEGSVVAEISDAFCPWNEGRWRIDGAGATQVEDSPGLRCDVSALGSVYLGGFTWAELARAGHVEELQPGAVAAADTLFRSDRAPWCPEIF